MYVSSTDMTNKKKKKKQKKKKKMMKKKKIHAELLCARKNPACCDGNQVMGGAGDKLIEA